MCAKIILTAPATEMSDYNGSPFYAFTASFSKPSFIPRFLLKKFLYKPVPSEGLHVSRAPYGLRKIEAKLLEAGFSEDEVLTIHPDNLEKAIGDDTKIVCISSMDPLGLAFVSITYSTILGLGDSMTFYEFKRLSQILLKYRPRIKVIVGGAGSWQLIRKNVMEKYGVDHVVIGEGESIIGDLIHRILNGENVEKIVRGSLSSIDEIPIIRRPAIHGIVEITRGCGRGCQFCSPTLQVRRSMPLDKIRKEVEVNVKAGENFILIATDDIFLYGCNNSRFIPNEKAILKMLDTIIGVEGVKYVQPAHSSMPPVLLNKNLVKKMAEILLNYSYYSINGKPIVTTEIGIETGSSNLIKKYMIGKPIPFKPEEWSKIVIESITIMNENEWYPLGTLIVGLPGETEEDVIQTLELLDELSRLKLFLVPLFFVPEETCYLKNQRETVFENLSELQREVFVKAWKYNIKIWGESFYKNRFKNPISRKILLKYIYPLIFYLLYGLKYRWMDEWRRNTAKEIYDVIRKIPC
ncbi:MAG TPA: B12-binding domain-containing radical SAM protein [Thermoprotei archaeon]|nr:B12-binding domain-containing radical SAM protein [Thermoprotei archaeon]